MEVLLGYGADAIITGKCPELLSTSNSALDRTDLAMQSFIKLGIKDKHELGSVEVSITAFIRMVWPTHFKGKGRVLRTKA